MAQQGCFSCFDISDFSKPPVLENIDFNIWKTEMIAYLKEIDYGMWLVICRKHDFTPSKDWTDLEKEIYGLNIKALKIILSALIDDDYQIVKHCTTAREAWMLLKAIYTTNLFDDCERIECSSSAEIFSQQEDEHSSQSAENGDIQSINTSNEEEEFNDELSSNGNDDESIDSSLVTDSTSNLSYVHCKNDLEILHHNVFQPIRDLISKSHDSLHIAGNEFLNANNYVNPSHSNSCKSRTRMSKSVTCNYCGKVGHISHLCHYRRNLKMRNSHIWVPKVHIMSKTNNQGPKKKWVPKCSISANQVQIIKEHNGTKKDKSSRSSFPLKRRLAKSTSSWRAYGQPIAAYNLINQKQQWRQMKRSSLMPRKRFIKSSSRRTHGQSKCANKLNPKRKWIKTKEVFIPPSYNMMPFNYEEMNKKATRERRRRTQWKKAQLNLYKNEQF